MTKKYDYLPHTADIKFRAYGKTLEECFENSASAMVNSMYSYPVKKKIKKNINIEAKDIESLLYDFLERILVLLDSKNLFTSKFKVKISNKINKKVSDKNTKNISIFRLRAELWGDNASNYQIGLDVKAITYNQMFVKKDNKTGLWTAQAVIDV